MKYQQEPCSNGCKQTEPQYKGGIYGTESDDRRNALRAETAARPYRWNKIPNWGRTLIGGTGYDIILGPQISKTWYFNAVIDATEYQGIHDEQIRFVSNGRTFDTIRFGYMMNTNAIAYLISGTATPAYYGAWQDQGFRTVMFEEAPSGTLLEFLIKNTVEK